MTEKLDETDRAIAAFMVRVADAHGRNDPAPDPDAVWLRARLEQRLERMDRSDSAEVWSTRLTAVALGLAALVVYRWTAPLFAGIGETALLTTGISLAAIVPLIWFLAWRPVRNAR